MEKYGVRLNFLTLTFIPDEQTRQAIDVATAMRIYESKGIKEVGEKAGWQEQYPKFMCKMGKWVELKKADGKSWKYYHHLSSHTMRRTAITSLLILGVPEQVVRKISGHAPGSKEFYKYVSIAEAYLSKEVQQAQLKLMNLNKENSF